MKGFTKVLWDICAVLFIGAVVFDVVSLCFYTSEMTCNDALDAGFTIIDPEGYTVERFDGGWHFTTEPRHQ